MILLNCILSKKKLRNSFKNVKLKCSFKTSFMGETPFFLHGEVATWEIVTWEVALGKMPLGKYLTPINRRNYGLKEL